MSAFDASFDVGQVPDAGRHDRTELAMLAHDIRGALNGVIGGMGEIEALDLSPGLREQVERVSTAARSLASLTAMMLGEKPDAAASGEPLKLPAFLRYVRSRWAGEAHRKGLGFDIVPATDLPAAMRIDHLPLARALGNLISNAIKYCDTGTVRLSLAREPDGGITFRVSDDGPGVEDGVLAPLLGDVPPKEANGHGLGLHIVRQISEEHGGVFAIANRPHRGAEAMLRFPAEICLEAAPAEDRGASPAPERSELEGLQILLAEDNPINQMVAAQMLRSLDAEVTVCWDGVEALERFEQARFDVVVVDIEMPRLSGLDVIRTIRARGDERAGVPIVALTAYALREHRDRVLEAGANGLISKPITSIEALGRDLAAHVRASSARPALAPPAATEVEDTGPVVDEAVYGGLVEAIGQEMMAELLGKVVADVCDARDSLAGALDPLDRGPIQSASHILISVAGAVGATRLQTCARALNITAHGAADDGIADAARRCVDEIDAAVAFIRERRAAR